MTSRKTILVVEDEKDLTHLLCLNLEWEGFRCRAVEDGRNAILEAERQPPDLIIMDRMIPGCSGDEVTQRLRNNRRTVRIPILMLTAKGEEVDQVVGFALGADDYMTKPFSMKLLLARIHALLRRVEAATVQTEVLSGGRVLLDVDRHEVTVGGKPVTLTVTEFKLLQALMEAHGRVLTRNQLIDQALGENVVVTDRTIDVHITSLRKKFGPDKSAARWIQTIRGVGYTFRQPEDSA